jgi:hypothetical protein
MFLDRPRVPVVQRLGHRPFTAVTRVRIPSGTPNTFKHLAGTTVFAAEHFAEQLSPVLHSIRCFSGRIISTTFCCAARLAGICACA